MLTDSLNRTPLTRAARLGMVAALAMVTVPLAGFAAMRQAPAAMVGTLVDQNGGAIADAPVMLAPVTGGDARKVTTDAQGQFAFEGVTPGEYRFDVKAMGFAPLHERVTLAPDQRLERRLALTLGSVQETLVVRGANPMALARDHRDPPRDHTNGPLEPPTLLRNALPAYPARLHDAGVQGVVNLDGIIAVDGTVTAITADPQSNPELAAAVREAVLLWRFDPTRLRGVPVETHIRITINFEL